MRSISIFVLLVSAASTMAQTGQKNAPPASEKLCGKLIEADESHLCCSELLLASKTTTGRWGSFHYDPKNSFDPLLSNFLGVIDAGDFWVSETVAVE